MPDWQSLDSKNFSKMSATAGREVSPRRRWIWAGLAALIFALAASYFAVRARRVEHRAVLTEDLVEAILEEETLRFLGQGDAALAWPAASETWQRAYRRSFETRQPAPGEVKITELDFDGQCAVITVTLKAQPEWRAYCLSQQGWLRAPLPTSPWAGAQQVIRLDHRLRLKFYERDRALAETLAADLERFLTRVPVWLDPSQERSVTRIYSDLDILIAPHELAGPLVSAKSRRITLNSPLLVPGYERNGLAAETAVRLALAEELLRRAKPQVSHNATWLPGGFWLLRASHTVGAMATSFDLESQAELIQLWRSQLQDWHSPFEVDLTYPGQPLFDRGRIPRSQALDAGAQAVQTVLSANLTMAYIHQLAGLDGLNLLVDRIAIDYGWDRLLQEVLRRPTSVLEQEAQTFAMGEPLWASKPIPSKLRLPLTAAISQTLWRPSGAGQIYALGPAGPLIFEVPPHLQFSTPSGEPLNPRCVARGATVTVNGEWLERGRRATADHVRIDAAGEFEAPIAPANTVAYLTQRLTSSQGGNRARSAIKWLVALTADGSLQPLLPLGSGFSIASLPIAAGGHPHFMFGYDLFECDRTWFVHYDFELGRATGWLGPPHPVLWFWRSDRQDVIFSRPEASGMPHQQGLYRMASALAPNQTRQADATLGIVGWNQAEQRLVALGDVAGQSYLGLLGLNRGEFQPVVRAEAAPMLSRRLSPDGSWLAYLSQPIALPPDRLVLVDLIAQSEQVVLDVKPEEGLVSPSWSSYVDQPALAFLAGPVDRDFRVYAKRLLVISPEQPDPIAVIAQATEGEEFAFPSFCRDGSLLYRVEKNGEYRLIHRPPGRRAKTLLSTDRAFEPVACGH